MAGKLPLRIHVVPPLKVRKSPPVSDATMRRCGLSGRTAMATARPPAGMFGCREITSLRLQLAASTIANGRHEARRIRRMAPPRR
jgi:hypothetical protein